MKKTNGQYLALWGILCFSLVPLCVLKSQASQIIEESISPMSFRAIQAAIPELERRKLDVRNYRITVVETFSHVSVLFQVSEAPAGNERRGRPPELTVVIDKVDFEISYIRQHP
jgi:hypothetical protein